MPIIKPKKLTSRGILSSLLPTYFCRPKHPQQMLPGDARTIKVPLDADELFYRKFFKRKKFRAKVMEMYDDNIKVVHRPKDSTWSPMPGCFVPRHQMVATHIFPLALGSNIMAFIRRAYGEMWSPVNGLMLPKPAEEAWKDLALTIVPDNSLDTIRSGNDHRNREYKFCVMDGKHPAVSRSLYKDLALYGLPEVTIEQFDNKRVNFGNTYRPRIDYFYFQSCSAVWKKTYLEDPECDDETNFVARFLSGITQYWHPKYVEKSRITDVFTFKCTTAPFEDNSLYSTAKTEVEGRTDHLRVFV